MRDDYPSLGPWPVASERDILEWSTSEVRDYAKWLTESGPQRIKGMCAYFGIRPRWGAPKLISELDMIASRAIVDAPFSERKKLTLPGTALVFDMGQLLAAALIDSSGGAVYWKLPTGRGKLASSRMPELCGFRDGQRVDPIRLSFVSAWKLLDGEAREGEWKTHYERWRTEVEAS